jgi:hypothetical protein
LFILSFDALQVANDKRDRAKARDYTLSSAREREKERNCHKKRSACSKREREAKRKEDTQRQC